KISKTQAVTSNIETGPLAGKKSDRNVHIGPSDYVAWLDDRKWAYVRLEGRAFGDVPLNMEYKLEVWDSPNPAGVVIHALRCCQIAKGRGWRGGATGQTLVPLAVRDPLGVADRRRCLPDQSRQRGLLQPGARGGPEAGGRRIRRAAASVQPRQPVRRCVPRPLAPTTSP